jgi:hypothetical protein
MGSQEGAFPGLQGPALTAEQEAVQQAVRVAALHAQRPREEGPGLGRDDVPFFKSFSDIPHQIRNPVRRGVQDPPACAHLNLDMEAGNVAMQKKNAPLALTIEYQNTAPLVSYLHDGLSALQTQVNSGDIPDDRRASLNICLGYLSEVYSYAETNLDLLKLKAISGKEAPALVKAVTQTVRGAAGLPLTNANVLSVLAEMQKAQIGQLAKQGAREMAEASLPARNRGNDAREQS